MNADSILWVPAIVAIFLALVAGIVALAQKNQQNDERTDDDQALYSAPGVEQGLLASSVTPEHDQTWPAGYGRGFGRNLPELLDLLGHWDALSARRVPDQATS